MQESSRDQRLGELLDPERECRPRLGSQVTQEQFQRLLNQAVIAPNLGQDRGLGGTPRKPRAATRISPENNHQHPKREFVDPTRGVEEDKRLRAQRSAKQTLLPERAFREEQEEAFDSRPQIVYSKLREGEKQVLQQK